MSEREPFRLFRDPPGELVDDLRYDSLGVFVLQCFEESLPNRRVWLSGVRGAGPAEGPLDLRQLGRHYRHRLVALDRVGGHGGQPIRDSLQGKAGGRPSALPSGDHGDAPGHGSRLGAGGVGVDIGAAMALSVHRRRWGVSGGRARARARARVRGRRRGGGGPRTRCR